MRAARAMLAALAAFALAGAADPDNPTCPATVNWGPDRPMTVTPAVKGGRHVLLAEGVIDTDLPARLRKAIEANDLVEEIWLRSSGGDAQAGNEAGKVIRSFPGMLTRIPAGWTCFSACNFVFMGGDRRVVEQGGVFMVHMFTHTDQRDVIGAAVSEGANETAGLIADIEQSSAILASDDNDFLIRMGISRKLLTDIMYRQRAIKTATDRSTRYCLNPDEVRRYNVMPLEKAG
jgi:hypothetical protein